MVQNYMETLVDNVLTDEFASHPEKYQAICKCSRCISIIKSAALNNLKPFYVTSLTGEVFGEFQYKAKQHMTDVLVAVGRGIDELMRFEEPHKL